MTFSTSAQAYLVSKWRPCSTLAIAGQKWVFLEYCVRACQRGKSPATGFKNSRQQLKFCTVMLYLQLSLTSLVPVASEGWCHLASGEWICSTLLVWTLLGTKEQASRAGELQVAEQESFSVSLLNQIVDREKWQLEMTSITFAGEQGKAFHGIFLMKCFFGW